MVRPRCLSGCRRPGNCGEKRPAMSPASLEHHPFALCSGCSPSRPLRGCFARRQAASEGRAALAAALVTVVVFVAARHRECRDCAGRLRQRFDVEGRALFPMLETLDPIARPIAIRYDALSRVSPAELPAVVQAVCSSGSADRSPACPGRLERAVSIAGGQVCSRSQGVRFSRVRSRCVDGSPGRPRRPAAGNLAADTGPRPARAARVRPPSRCRVRGLPCGERLSRERSRS